MMRRYMIPAVMEVLRVHPHAATYFIENSTLHLEIQQSMLDILALERHTSTSRVDYANLVQLLVGLKEVAEVYIALSQAALNVIPAGTESARFKLLEHDYQTVLDVVQARLDQLHL